MSNAKRNGAQRRDRGLTLIEVLVSVVVLLVGLLGLAALMSSSQKAEAESYQRAQALLLLEDMASRINANRAVAPCYAITTAGAGSPFLGVGADVSSISCGLGSTSASARAREDLLTWSNLLAGASEISANGAVGVMTGARGCITQDSAGAPGATSTYTVSIAWQGLTRTKAPGAGLSCAINLYGDEKLRRVISLPVSIADLR